MYFSYVKNVSMHNCCDVEIDLLTCRCNLIPRGLATILLLALMRFRYSLGLGSVYIFVSYFYYSCVKNVSILLFKSILIQEHPT